MVAGKALYNTAAILGQRASRPLTFAAVAAFCVVTVALPSFADAVAPDLVTSEALFWFDASTLSAAGTELDSWADVRGGSYPTFTTYTSIKPQVIEIADGALAGKKAVDFGTLGTACDMRFASVQNVKTAFFVVDLEQQQLAFLLAGPKNGVGVAPRNYGFHRGTGGTYRYPKDLGSVQYWNDGKPVADPVNTLIPTGYQLITWKWDSAAQVEFIGNDRELSGRPGGRRGLHGERDVERRNAHAWRWRHLRFGGRGGDDFRSGHGKDRCIRTRRNVTHDGARYG